jgi:hypothetical protein
MGHRREVHRFNGYLCVNVYLGITRFGTTALVPVAGSSKHKTYHFTKQGKVARNITAAEYDEVLRRHLLPKGQELMTKAGHREWTFQQDNDPTHRAARDVIVKYNRQHVTSINLLPSWPPHSPDLSPIENLWAHLQRQLDKAGCKHFKSWLATLKKLATSVGAEWLEHAYAGMPGRIQDVIAKGGDKTNH